MSERTPDDVKRDSQNLASELATMRLVVATEQMQALTKAADAVVKRAEANGFATRKEAAADRRSVNANTWGAGIALILALFALVHFLVDPVQRQVDGLVLDVRELYKTSQTGAPSPRLEGPPEAAK